MAGYAIGEIPAGRKHGEPGFYSRADVSSLEEGHS